MLQSQILALHWPGDWVVPGVRAVGSAGVGAVTAVYVPCSLDSGPTHARHQHPGC